MQAKLENVRSEAEKLLASVSDAHELLNLKSKFLGKNSLLAELFKELGKADPASRGVLGKEINGVKTHIEALVKDAESRIEKSLLAKKLQIEKIDITLPGETQPKGSIHVVNQVQNEIVKIFTDIGYRVALGPEVETDFYNFEALNFPKNHPARDMQDTFYVTERTLLRTHTSPVQIRAMFRANTWGGPPIQIVAPGVVYRSDDDITHSPMFHQVEGLFVDVGVRFSDLKGVLNHFAKELFGNDVKLRFRPSFFPFTEPSAEVDISCVICGGKGCRTCGQSGWLEILGSGMVHPNVLKACKINPDKFSGFAFGVGVERVAMLKHGIPDIRYFFQNDVRFLGQFR